MLTFLNLYVGANLLLAAALGLFAAVRAIDARAGRLLDYGQQLRLGQALAACAVLLPLVSARSEVRAIVPRAADVWSMPASGGTGSTTRGEVHAAIIPSAAPASFVPLAHAGGAVVVLCLSGLLIILVMAGKDAWTVSRFVVTAQTIRRRRRVRILTSDITRVPFSFWIPGRAFIVLPSTLILRPDDLRLAIRHEAQHHRQGDTRTLYLHLLFKGACLWNPAVHRLERRLRELQEFACDEALGRQNVSPHAYCRCLLRVAAGAAGGHWPATRLGMVGQGEVSLLKRRIDALLRHRPSRCRRTPALAIGIAALVVMTVAAFACGPMVLDRRVSAADAVRMADAARSDSRVPMVVNDRVVRQLNLLLSTPDGRASLDASLERMREYETAIAGQLAEYDVPRELLAVPLVESGYQNLVGTDNPWRGAGV